MTQLIPLTKGQYAIVDDEDYDKIVAHKWCCHIAKGGDKYAVRAMPRAISKKRKSIYMHHVIALSPPGKIVDHKDGDTLNNTRSNLRVCGLSENNMNKRLQKNNTSGVRGVCWHKRFDKWQAKIKINGKVKYLGYFDNLKEAETVRQEAENELFGEFSYHNSRTP